MKVKYSIIIPTRNRAEYLPFAIKSVLNSSRKDIELIVSNNFSTDKTQEILSKISDSRLRVISPNTPLPMSGHYEFALSKAKGEWITILGDDDAVMPHIFESLDKYINKYNSVDIISSNRSYYFWKGCENIYGNLVVSYSSKFSAKIRLTKNDLFKVLLGLKNCFELPQIYTGGIIKRSLYDEIKYKSGGHFYHSIIPDIYSSVALCLTRDTYLRTEESLFWTGTSNKSTGISNRIYLDAKNLTTNSTDYKQVPKKISDEISYFLHSKGFGSLYIFEGLAQCPFKGANYKIDKIRELVLAGLYSNFKIKQKSSERIKIRSQIRLECRKYKLMPIKFVIIVIILIILRVICNIYLFPKLFGKKFGYLGYHKFSSNNRKKFFNILDASSYIEKLRQKINL